MRIEWFILIIPAVTALGLFLKFKHKTLWWEFLIPFGASVALIAFMKLSSEAVQTHDVEYHGGWVVEAKYYEAWDEWIDDTCYNTVSCGEGCSNQIPYDCSYAKEHAARAELLDSNGYEISIDVGVFQRLAKQFDNNSFIDLGRDYHSYDGDMYQTRWDGRDESREFVTTRHIYENRAQASTEFNFEKVDPEKFDLFEYPDIKGYYQLNSILGDGGPTLADGQKMLNEINAKLGRSKKVRVWFLIFTDKPREAGFAQEQYWKRGNKNEIVVTIGTDKNYNVKWSHAFSWTEVKGFNSTIGGIATENEVLDIPKTIDWMRPVIEKRWVKKSFKEFNHLSVVPPTWLIALSAILVVLINLGLSSWIIKNEYCK